MRNLPELFCKPLMREEGIAEWVNTVDQKTNIAIFNNK